LEVVAVEDVSKLLGNVDGLRQQILESQRMERFLRKMLKVTLQARGELPRNHGNRKDVVPAGTGVCAKTE
jgi:hypothetical protein